MPRRSRLSGSFIALTLATVLGAIVIGQSPQEAQPDSLMSTPDLETDVVTVAP